MINERQSKIMENFIITVLTVQKSGGNVIFYEKKPPKGEMPIFFHIIEYYDGSWFINDNLVRPSLVADHLEYRYTIVGLLYDKNLVYDCSTIG